MKNLCCHEFRIRDLSRKKSFFITGSGTNVGKTFASAFIARSLIAEGEKVVYMKPVQTGATECSSPDIQTVRKICPEIIIDEKLSCPYCFNLPASPHFASKCENRKIHLAKILRAFDKIKKKYKDAVIIVEGAGGVMVPIIKTYMMIDLIKDMEVSAIVVTLPNLGTINHTLLTCQALRAKKIPIEGIAFSQFSIDSEDIARDNMQTIRNLAKIRNCGIIPLIES